MSDISSKKRRKQKRKLMIERLQFSINELGKISVEVAKENDYHRSMREILIDRVIDDLVKTRDELIEWKAK